MKKAQIHNGRIINIVEFNTDAAPHWSAGWLEVNSEEVQIGWEWDGETFVPPRTVIPPLSFAQLLIGLVSEGWITEAEGEAWLSGQALPASAAALISTLPPEQRFPAKARMLRLSQADRLDPLVEALATAEGKTPEQIDAFFLTYGQV